MRTPLEQLKLAIQMLDDQVMLSAEEYRNKYYPEDHSSMPLLHIRAAVSRLEAIEQDVRMQT